MNQLFNPTTDREEYKSILVDGVHCYGKPLTSGATVSDDNLLKIEARARFIRKSVDHISSVAYVDLMNARFGSGIEEGITAAQLIETSPLLGADVFNRQIQLRN